MDHAQQPQAASARAEPTLPQRRYPAVRGENPELWDLEHEFERRRTEQLAEVWQKSARVVELMARVEELEPLTRELAERERELAALREALGALERAHHALEESHRTIGEACRASEEARRTTQAESERRLAELEKLGADAVALCERVRQLEEDLAGRRRDQEAFAARTSEERVAFVQRVEGLERSLDENRIGRATAERESGAKLAELQAELQQRGYAFDGVRQAAEALKAELEASRNELAARSEASRKELAARDGLLAERDGRIQQLADESRVLRSESLALRNECDQTAAALATSQRENQKLEQAWRSALEQLELQRSERRKHDGQVAATLAALTEIRPMIRALESKLQTQAEELVANAPATDASRTGPNAA